MNSAHRLLQLAEPSLVGREKQERIAEDARLLAAPGQDLIRGCSGLALGVVVVRIVGPEHNEPRLHLVRHLAAALGDHMHGGERAAFAVLPEAA